MTRLCIGLVGALATAATVLAPGAQALSSKPAKIDVTNGTVNAVVPTADAIYIGGKFTKVGPRTGEWVGIDSSTAKITGLPPVSGGQTVRAAAPDGAGGFYIGGNFTHVGGLARRNLAHILADGSVDPDFAPNPNGQVNALAVSGSTVYVGGDFFPFNPGEDSIGGEPRIGIAALDAATGNATSWNPSAILDNVDSLAVSGSTVYVGGDFFNIGDEERGCIAAVDRTTGAATSLGASGSGNHCRVRTIALAPSGATVYVGGDFDRIGGQARNNIAALNTTTGAARSWNPNAQGGRTFGSNNDYTSVDALHVSGSLVYAGGLFTSIGGAARNNIAALDRTTGAATSWNPNATTTGFSPAHNGDVYTLAVSGSTVYAGGFFDHIGGQARDGIAALDAATGAPTSWNPRINRASPNPSVVYALAISGPTVYAGGRFAAIGGQTRRNVAALDPATGKVTSWNPNANREVDALGVSGSTVYAGGDFTSIGGQARNRIAALDAAAGTARNWNPNATRSGGGSPPTIHALARSGSTVYAGGVFDHIGGAARNNIAALDAATGAATSWNPNSNGEVDALRVSGSTVYAGGGFSTLGGYLSDSIGGQPRDGVAALDATTGAATSWNPSGINNGSCQVFSCPGHIHALAVSGSTVYAGGLFSSSRKNVAAFDRTTGGLTSWNPIPNSVVHALEFGPDGSLWAGGAFTGFDAAPQSGIARFAP